MSLSEVYWLTSCYSKRQLATSFLRIHLILRLKAGYATRGN